MRGKRTQASLSLAYRRYALAVMTAVYTLNFVDRGLVMLLLEPIKRDLALSDSQLGFLTGIAFGLFYAVLGLPLARWADRGNRVTITSLAIGLWGVTVMGTLYVASFSQMLLARVAAAVGEAGCKPPTYSLLGDYFPGSAERTRAMAIYMTGGLSSTLVSFVAGGYLNELYGWRMAFFLMGIPGLLIALLVRLTIVEPRIDARLSSPAREQPPLRAVLLMLWRQRSCRHLCIALIWLYTMSLGLGPWYAAFMIRSHDMTTSDLGLWLGLIFGLGGIAGVLLGGYVTTRWFANDERGQVRVSAATVATLVPCFLAFLTVPGKYQALVTLIPLIVVFSFFLGPTYALMQRLVADEMRATTMAVVMLLANLIGMGVGPQVVGLLSDALVPVAGIDSLRYAMVAMSGVALLSAFHFWRVGSTVKEDLANVMTPALASARDERRSAVEAV
jgi:predicted MFS family arabinose efflux permease